MLCLQSWQPLNVLDLFGFSLPGSRRTAEREHIAVACLPQHLVTTLIHWGVRPVVPNLGNTGIHCSLPASTPGWGTKTLIAEELTSGHNHFTHVKRVCCRVLLILRDTAYWTALLVELFDYFKGWTEHQLVMSWRLTEALFLFSSLYEM